MIEHLTSYPRRIICLTEETTETLYLLGEQERVVGVSGYTVRPPEAIEQDLLPKEKTDAALGLQSPQKPVEHVAVQ